MQRQQAITIQNQLWVLSGGETNNSKTTVRLQGPTSCLQPVTGSNRVVLDNCASVVAQWTVVQSALIPVPPTPGSSSGLSLWTIVGIAVGGAVAVGLAVGILVFCLCRKNRRKDEAEKALLDRTEAREQRLAAQNEARARSFVDAQSSAMNIAGSGIPHDNAPPNYRVTPVYGNTIPLANMSPQGAQGQYPQNVSSGSPRTPVSAELASLEGAQCTATRPYNAKYADELELRPGDVVLCEKVHEDGWGQVGLQKSEHCDDG